MVNKLRARTNLIVLDGLDGVGKTSGVRVIEQYLKENFPETRVEVAEGYTFTEFSKDLKALMMKHKPNVSHNVLYNLFRAIWTDAWELHGEEVKAGKKFLLSDRWLLSTAVYQDEDDSRTNNLIASTHAIPGLTILLTASGEVAKTRINRDRVPDHFETEYFQAHDKLQKRFIEKLPTYSDEYQVIHTDNLSQDEVAQEIRRTLDHYFGKN